MPGDMGGFFGGGSDMEDRMNQENITLDEDDVDDIETFVSGISAATISYTTRSAVDGGDLDEAQTYSIAGVKDNYAAISNLSLAVGDFITESDDENKEKSLRARRFYCGRDLWKCNRCIWQCDLYR